MSSVRLKDALAAVPDGALDTFLKGLEELQTRVELAGQSYRGLLDAAREANDARAKLAYFIVTLTLGILTWYYYLATRPDEQYEVLRHYVPCIGLLADFVFMTIGQHRMVEECTYTHAAKLDEHARGIKNGAGAIRAEVLALDKYWSPTRVAIAGFGSAVVFSYIAVVEFWYM